MASFRKRTVKKPEKVNPEDDIKTYPPSDITIPLIRRKFWFGLEPKETQIKQMTEPHNRVCFVSSESPECSDMENCLIEVAEIQKRNMVFKDWPDIPFNFLIGGDGNIYEGRGWLSRYEEFGSPAIQQTLQIAYLGYFKDKDPPQNMVELGSMLIEYGKQRNFIAKDFLFMECPLDEYYQFPNCGLEAYYNSPEYAEFVATVPPPLPPRPPKTL